VVEAQAAAIAPQITVRWEMPVDSSGRGEMDPAEWQLWARERYRRAMQALGPIQSPVVVAVAIEDLSIHRWCGGRTGRLRVKAADLLRARLLRLAAHYGIPASD
jgi:hypothetical protein